MGEGQLPNGTVVAERYRVSGTLGRGATGTVYAVEHTRTSRALAMKVLHPELGAAPDLTRRFEREAQAIAKLEHPHVLSVIDFGQAPEVGWYLVTDKVEGVPLSAALAAHPEWAPAAFSQLLDVLEHAHAQGILHRDLKPDNVLVAERAGQPHVTVLDFGLAKVLQDGGEALTQQGAVFGTPRYMSPEQAGGEPATPASDQYAVGVMLFEVYEGRAPFEGGSVAEILTKHITASVPPFERTAARMGSVITRALDKDPAARFRSARDLDLAMQEALHSASPTTSPRTEVGFEETLARPKPADSGRSGRSWRALAAGAGALAVLALGLALGGEDPLDGARAHLEAGRLDAAAAVLDAELASAPKSAQVNLLLGHVARAREHWEEAADRYQAALASDWSLAEDPQLVQGLEDVFEKRRKRGRALARWIAESADEDGAALLARIAKAGVTANLRRKAFEGLERVEQTQRLDVPAYLEAELKRARSAGCRTRRWYVERLLGLDDEDARAVAEAEIRRKDALLGLVPQSGCMKGLLRKADAP